MPKIVAVDTDFEDNNLEEAMARDCLLYTSDAADEFRTV